MKTPRDFDYDIWKDDSGYYYIRVKRTGETARVSKDVVRELWRDMYRMEKYRRNTTMAETDGSRRARILSLDDNRAVNRRLYTDFCMVWIRARGVRSSAVGIKRPLPFRREDGDYEQYY